MQEDGIKWHPKVRIDKYSPEQIKVWTEFLGHEPTSVDFADWEIEPESVTELDGNQLVSVGLTRIRDLILGTGATGITSTSARIGVGNGTAGFSAAHVDLQGASKRFNILDSLTPGTSKFTAVATFGTGDANFAWEEWCIDIKNTGSATSGNTINDVLLNRKVGSQGTKASGAVWVFTVDVTIS